MGGLDPSETVLLMELALRPQAKMRPLRDEGTFDIGHHIGAAGVAHSFIIA